MRSAAGDFSVLRSAGFSAGLVVKRIKLLNAVFKEIVMRYVGYQQSQHKRGGGKHTGVFRDEKSDKAHEHKQREKYCHQQVDK